METTYFIPQINLQVWWKQTAIYSASQKKRKPINQVNFSENYNELSKKDYIVTKFILSSFFWPQLQDVLVMHGRARTISNGDVKIYLRRIGS